MKRREVLTGLTALVVVPVLPTQVVNLTAPTAVELIRTNLVAKTLILGMDGVYTEGIMYETIY